MCSKYCFRVARTASLSISNLLTPILISIGDLGGIDNAIRINEFLRSGVYNYNGNILIKF
ncbi:MAG: hypothetical protein CM15mP112_06150 [Flavobacteriales bacterium]|nr:MAG: hypothetical protein CM15mP112_06150 [Flavobacteriales bacterium]